LDDETYRQARISAAEENTSVSALVKRFLTTKIEGAGARTRAPELLGLAGELRRRTADRERTPSEILKREGQDERNAPVHGARAALLSRLHSGPVVAVGRWSRDELYEDER
jgi:plasmid stability protein